MKTHYGQPIDLIRIQFNLVYGCDDRETETEKEKKAPSLRKKNAHILTIGMNRNDVILNDNRQRRQRRWYRHESCAEWVIPVLWSQYARSLTRNQNKSNRLTCISYYIIIIMCGSDVCLSIFMRLFLLPMSTRKHTWNILIPPEPAPLPTVCRDNWVSIWLPIPREYVAIIFVFIFLSVCSGIWPGHGASNVILCR